MGYGRIEKICPHEPAKGYRRYLKLAAKRKRRQEERENPEDAPKKNRYYGWSE